MQCYRNVRVLFLLVVAWTAAIVFLLIALSLGGGNNYSGSKHLSLEITCVVRSFLCKIIRTADLRRCTEA